ncbi:MAG: hypothetical protein ABUS54_07805 [Actinomycetota bacterium]
MILQLAGDRVALLEHDTFDKLGIVDTDRRPAAAIAGVLGGTADDGHVWVPAARILELGAEHGAEWADSARATFRAVERFGWYDAATDRVRVHVAP